MPQKLLTVLYFVGDGAIESISSCDYDQTWCHKNGNNDERRNEAGGFQSL